MKLILIILFFLNHQTNQRLARIVDEDGFTNVREGQGLSFPIVEKVNTGELFYCETENSGDWVKVQLLKWRLGNYITGYIHKSRVQLIEDLDTKEQEDIAMTVLKHQKHLADKFAEAQRKYDRTLDKWNNKTDSIAYRNSVRELEQYHESQYYSILTIFPRLFCNSMSNKLIAHLIETIWSDRGSADEMPSFTLGECFACGTSVVSNEIKQLKNVEQKQLMIDNIEWGLLNKFYVGENKESTDPQFLKLKKELETMRN